MSTVVYENSTCGWLVRSRSRWSALPLALPIETWHRSFCSGSPSSSSAHLFLRSLAPGNSIVMIIASGPFHVPSLLLFTRVLIYRSLCLHIPCIAVGCRVAVVRCDILSLAAGPARTRSSIAEGLHTSPVWILEACFLFCGDDLHKASDVMCEPRNGSGWGAARSDGANPIVCATA